MNTFIAFCLLCELCEVDVVFTTCWSHCCLWI